MTSEQRDIALMVSLLLVWISSWTNSWVASHEITMMMAIRSRDSSPFTTAQWCLFNANQKKAFEQIVKLLEIYNEHCVWRGCRKCPFHRYWILIIPWLNKLLNKQTGCIAFPMNIVVVLKKLLNKQMSFLNQKSEFVWTKCHLSGPAQLWSDAFNNWWPRSRYIIWLELWSWCIRNKHCLKLSYLVTPHWTLTTVKWFIWCVPL